MRRRIPRWASVVLGVAVVAGVPVAWYLGSPLFITRTVDEPSPGGVATGAVLARGAFAGADDFHKGSGMATVYRVGEGLVLRLEPFQVTNGPDLHVILTAHPTPRTRADVMAAYVELGRLKGNVGGQNYALPRGVALADVKAVVIYCKPFHVVFAVAPLAPAN
ncbi:MAG: DM13 domain-containing protein [Armatimonadota bacterium]|nr:DM13 domain-containing protein [Armatimonadota bacterium]MDR7497452.1 DM13 domain-containing protein [Armatimonadota bacterium]MDR7510470.1 DM13 domain-containing protein [Armatimonadota bacterium]